MPALNSRCPVCSAEVRADAPLGLCLKCLLLQGAQGVPDDLPQHAVAGQMFGDYEVYEEIGRGGVGVIYRARQRSLDRQVALKMISRGRSNDPTEIVRLRSEAITAGSLRHPNVVSIYETGEVDGHLFISMELIVGRNLAELVRDQPMEVSRAARYLEAVARAVHAAHQINILHRDLKPANILIDRDNQPRITDFGVAKQLGNDLDLTITGQPIGTPAYMPPEQVAFNKAKLGPWSDVYSIGAVLYHLLTGRPPFLASSLAATFAGILESDPVAPRLLSPSVPRDLETICLKCLSKEPTARYSSAEALADDLRRFLAKEPIQARQTNALKRAILWSRRRPAFAGLVGLLVVSLIVGAGSTLWQVHQLRVAKTALTSTVEDLQLQRADALVGAGRPRQAMEGLISLLRQNPTNRVAAARLVSSLLNENRPRLRWWYTNATEAVPMAFSRDGSRLFVKSWEGWGQIWSSNDGQPTTPRLGHTKLISWAEFHPGGKWVCTASVDTTARIWDVDTGAELASFKHPAEVSSAALSRDGRWLATGCIDAVIRLWDLQTMRLASVWHGHKHAVTKLSFSPDAKRLLSGSIDSTARLWNLTGSDSNVIVLKHDKPILVASFTAKGEKFVTSSLNSVKLWRSSDAHQVSREIRHSAEVVAVDFTSDERSLLTVSLDSTARIWDAATGDPLRNPFTHNHWIWSGGFLPGSTHVFTASDDGSAKIWDARTGLAVTEGFGTGASIATAFSSPVGRSVALGDNHGNIQFWDFDYLAIGVGIELTLPEFYQSSGSAEGGTLVTTQEDGSALLWDDVKFSRQGRLEHSHFIYGVAFNSNGTLLATFSNDKGVKLWDAKTGAGKSTAWILPEVPVLGAFTPSGGELLVVDAKGIVHVIDLSIIGAEPTHFEIPPGCKMDRCAPKILHDESNLVVGAVDGTLGIWSRKAHRWVRGPWRLSAGVNCLDITADERLLVAGCRDGQAHLIECEDGAVRPFLIEHQGSINSVCFSPDGSRVVTGADDHTIKIWDVATGSPLNSPFRVSQRVRYVGFRDGGSRVVFACAGAQDRALGYISAPPVKLPMPVWFLDWSQRVLLSPALTDADLGLPPDAGDSGHGVDSFYRDLVQRFGPR